MLSTIKTFAPDCDVLAFGSRYSWTAKDTSDLDLAFIGNEKLGLAKRTKIEMAFEATDLPYRVDVVDYNSVSNSFRNIIDSGNEIIHRKSRASEKWRKVRLGDICKTNHQTYSLSEKWPFVNYLDTGNIKENRIGEIQHIVVGREALPSRARRKITVGDILYSTVRPNQRHYGIVKDILPNMLVSTGFAVITPNKAVVDGDFLYYYLAQNHIVDNLHAIGEQSVSAYPSIRPSEIENLELLLPPLEEQIKIGRTLRALDDKIENNTKMNRILEEMTITLFGSWYVDFEPWGGVMPEEWRKGTVSDLGEIIGGSTPSRAKPDITPNAVLRGLLPKICPSIRASSLTTEQTISRNSGFGIAAHGSCHEEPCFLVLGHLSATSLLQLVKSAPIKALNLLFHKKASAQLLFTAS
jgi:predicted nucleotidyltransferase